MIESVIFDLDGTLWDSGENVHKVWNMVLSKYGYGDEFFTLDDIHGFMGKQISEIAEIAFPDLPENEGIKYIYSCCTEQNGFFAEHGGVLFRGLSDVLEKLHKKYKLIIVSNCLDGYIQAFFAAHGLEKYFVDFESAGATGLSKGENISLVMERNNISSAVYVGDTAGDEIAARRAGIPFIHAAYGFGKPVMPDYTASRIEEIPGIVDSL